MKNRYRTIALPLVLVILATTASCSRYGNIAPKVEAKSYYGSIVWNGLERTFLTHTPPSFTKTRSIPLVIALHGGGGNAEAMVKLTMGGLNTLADKEGFVVIYPEGIEKNWNDGRSGNETDYRAHEENIDDVGFISALIDYQIKNLNIDPKRVYVTGMSNGAMMSLRLGCELAGKITAIAPVAGSIPQNLLAKCLPSGTVSVLLMNGTDDPLVPLGGGYITGPFGVKKIGKVISVDETINLWVNNNKCMQATVITDVRDEDPQDGATVQVKTYTGCGDGTEVILYTINGGGHTWPGGYQYLSKNIVGNTCRDINANEVIWNFFKRHSKQ